MFGIQQITPDWGQTPNIVPIGGQMGGWPDL